MENNSKNMSEAKLTEINRYRSGDTSEQRMTLETSALNITDTYYATPHYYDNHLIALIMSGQGTLVMNDSSCRFKKGDMIFLPKNLIQSVVDARDLEAKIVVINDETLMYLPAEVRQVINFNLLINRGFRHMSLDERSFNVILGIFEALNEENKESKNARFHNEVSRSLFAAFMGIAIRSITRETKVDLTEDNLFTSLLKLIDQNYKSHLRVTDYASLLGVSAKTLDRHIIKLAGVSPQKIIAQKMTSEAKSLLRSSEAPIKEIAFQLGFVDLSQFTNFFKNSTGITPSHFRQMKKKPAARAGRKPKNQL